MKKAVSIFLVLAMAVGCFAGCGSKEAKKDADKFYIGGIGPTTGDAAIYGTTSRMTRVMQRNPLMHTIP